MRSLAESGIVERRRKGGTTVRADRGTRATLDIPVTRLEVEGRGDTYSYRLLSRKRTKSTASITNTFGLSRPQETLRVTALHLSNARPYTFEDRWISLKTVPEITEVDLAQESANEWLVCNRPYDRCDVEIFANACSAADAARLKLAVGTAVLVIERTTWIGGAPITHVRAVSVPSYRLSASTIAK